MGAPGPGIPLFWQKRGLLGGVPRPPQDGSPQYYRGPDRSPRELPEPRNGRRCCCSPVYRDAVQSKNSNKFILFCSCFLSSFSFLFFSLKTRRLVLFQSFSHFFTPFLLLNSHIHFLWKWASVGTSCSFLHLFHTVLPNT